MNTILPRYRILPWRLTCTHGWRSGYIELEKEADCRFLGQP